MIIVNFAWSSQMGIGLLSRVNINFLSSALRSIVEGLSKPSAAFTLCLSPGPVSKVRIRD